MSSEGPNSPGTMADDASIGTVAWNNPDNAKISDNIRATIGGLVLVTGVASHYLKATNFGFTIPAGSTINGIVVGIEREATFGLKLQDNSVKLVKAGVISGNDNATPTLWPGSDTYEDHGSATDLWGLVLTPTDINDANFGVAVSVVGTDPGGDNALVDHIRITVFYTSSSPKSTGFLSFLSKIGSFALFRLSPEDTGLPKHLLPTIFMRKNKKTKC